MDRSVLYALLSMVFAGVTAVIAKAGMRNVSGDVTLVVRTSLVFVLAWATVLGSRQVDKLGLLTRRDLLYLLLSGATTFFSWLFYYRALKIGDVSTVAVIDKASIVVMLLLAFLVLKEPLTWRPMLGGGLILVGLLVLVVK